MSPLDTILGLGGAIGTAVWLAGFLIRAAIGELLERRRR